MIETGYNPLIERAVAIFWSLYLHATDTLVSQKIAISAIIFRAMELASLKNSRYQAKTPRKKYLRAPRYDHRPTWHRRP